MNVGDQLGPLTVPVTRETLVRYAGASGDFNPIHYSDHAARALGLDGVIAHGMLTLAVVNRLLTGLGRVHSERVRFREPVPVPDDGIGAELVITGEVAAIDDGVATIKLSATCAGRPVLRQASAQVALD